jgi:hypothetical protein
VLGKVFISGIRFGDRPKPRCPTMRNARGVSFIAREEMLGLRLRRIPPQTLVTAPTR